MGSRTATPRNRRVPTGRPRGRPPGSTAARMREIQLGLTSVTAASEPPPKRRRYIPGGAGGGGRYLEIGDDDDTPTVPRARPRPSSTTVTPFPTRERSTRNRNPPNREEPDEMRYSSAAAVAAAVVQSEGYKPREERGWEEFHPNLDIDAIFMAFHSDDVDGTAKSAPGTPKAAVQDAQMNGSSTPSSHINVASTGNTPNPLAGSSTNPLGLSLGTPPPRRRGRPPRDPVSFYTRASDIVVSTPKTPKVLPIHNQTPKERLDLKQPTYRKTDRILLFESKTFGQARYVDKGMMNAGYQESDNFIRPDMRLIKATDLNVEDDLDQSAFGKADSDAVQPATGNAIRVEYDMDEQDDMWLETINVRRKEQDLLPITREHFEITITKIEKEWHALEKRIPKPNPKPPQTHRPRSSSAAAVNGEPQVGEEQDSKCAICDDGDCENTNAIVFCDGCDLAVHQECYGVPFIPEGQWLCRKCQLIGRGIPTCIFCPNTDGAFKQTNSSKWAHLLCAMWIPEVSLGNHTFMEPVMDVEKVPKNRWKLSCYICNQKMGACIQCGNKSCYQAFHVTCARRARLYLKMKNSQGALAVLDGSMILKAFCDKHCPPDYTKENSVHEATKAAKKFYKRTMRGRIWADSHAAAHAIAATHRHALTEHPPDESQMMGAKLSASQGDNKKGQPGKPIWKLPSGAPVIPQAVFEVVEAGLGRFSVQKRKEFVAEACRYWTLKREARRGAALLKRLQLQMETFSSMELTRRNFATMGPSGKNRLTRRLEFADTLLKDLEQLRSLSDDLVHRELVKLEAAELTQEFVDMCYFPVTRLIVPIIDKALSLDKDVFKGGLAKLQVKLDQRFYTTTLGFWQDLCNVIYEGINTDPPSEPVSQYKFEPMDASPTKRIYADIRQRRVLGKRILKMVQPMAEKALRTECDITSKGYDDLHRELLHHMESSSSIGHRPAAALNGDDNGEPSQDVIMVDALGAPEIAVAEPANGDNGSEEHEGEDGDEPMGMVDDGEPEDGGNIEVNTSGLGEVNGTMSSTPSVSGHDTTGTDKPHKNGIPNGVQLSNSPPGTNGYGTIPRIMPPAPPTPPQSTGSQSKETPDILSEGGVPWYLKSFDPLGLSVVEEQWAGKDIVRGLSEDLTDIDDDELKGLGLDVNGGAIIAAPATGDHLVDSIVGGGGRRSSGKIKKRTSTNRRRR